MSLHANLEEIEVIEITFQWSMDTKKMIKSSFFQCSTL